MTRLHNAMKSAVLWTFGGTVYFLAEVCFKTATGRPQAVSWTMLILAAILCIPLDLCNERMSWRTPIWAQAILGGLAITAAELCAGIVLNLWLGLGIWDYSGHWGNLRGQVCPTWTGIWIAAAGFGIAVFDWLRWVLWPHEENKPRYQWRWTVK